MEKEEEQLLDFLSQHYRGKYQSSTIEDIKYDAFRGELTSKIIDKNKYKDLDLYDDFKVRDFLISYKISRLEELNIITSATAESLRILILLRQSLEDELGELLDRERRESYLDTSKEMIQERKRAIYKKWFATEEELKEYHLDGNILDFKKAIDGIISMEEYPPKKKRHNK